MAALTPNSAGWLQISIRENLESAVEFQMSKLKI